MTENIKMTQLAHPYDSSNIFTKILSGHIPAQKIYEDEHVLSFYDIAPKAKIHALVIPKGSYVSSRDFHENASDMELVGYYRGINKTLEALDLDSNASYRLISNCGEEGGQVVFHYHTHILAGEPLRAMYPDS